MTGQRSGGLPNICHEFARGLSDEAWLHALIRSTSSPVVDGVTMPGFPEPSLQESMVGTAGEAALREAFRSWREVKAYFFRLRNIPLDEANVLDFGCGWGCFVRFVLKDTSPARIVGVDVDEAFIDLCHQLLPGIAFQTVPAFPPTKLPADHFDLVYAYSVFSHLAEPAHLAWVGEFSRILRAGGLVIATTQSRAFIDYCEWIRQTGAETSWHRSLCRSFVDTKDAKARYERGEFLYSRT
jgi:2-polyprenyl-3-methyl-5-hydroxy-6-metoxy-1,4-benzoquinol methylase